MPSKYDWEQKWAEARTIAPTCRSIQELADCLKLPVNTLKSRLRKDGHTPESLGLGTQLRPNEQILTKDDGPNMREISYHGQRILTMEQLLAVCQVDLDVWRIADDGPTLNKWEVGAKCEYKDLTWHQGVLSGAIHSTGKLTIEPLFQIKLKLVRIKPIPIYPTVQPVEVTAGTFVPPKKREGLDETGWYRELVWADPHFWFRLAGRGLQPLHHRGVLDIICQVAALLNVDGISCLGDIFDLPELSKFWQDPAVAGYWQPSILEAYYWFSRMAAIARLRAHEGNHDLRLPKSMATHMRAAYMIKAAHQMDLPPVLSLPGLLAFHELGVEWVAGYPKDETWLNDAVVMSHGDVVRKGPGATATAVAQEARESRLFGHIHRVEMAVKAPQYGGHPVIACGVGCACHTDGRVPGAAYPDWQNGFAIVEYDPAGAAHSITPYVITDNRVVVNGQLIEAVDRADEIRAAYPDWF